MSLALYRKYRSSTFADLIGQDHVAVTLRNQVRTGELAHAYLFTGIRGTGKTSTARILARAVTCLDIRDGEPCNRCAACTEVLSGAAVDVLEIDAASNRGIDEMRELRERVKFLPASLRRKVYIVDEAHMLTTEAWNALLKTLEEPPPHVLFVLATTEPHKVPETVRSRVQRFDFRRVTTPTLAAHLEHVAAEEGAAVDGDAIELLAQAGQGSVRDAMSLLDQALSASERPVSVGAVRRALGLADPGVLRGILVSMASGDGGGVLRSVQLAFDGGADARQLLRELARLSRAAEYVVLGYPEGGQTVGEEAVLCAELAELGAGRPSLFVDAIDRFAEAEINLRQPVDARLQVELALLRLVHRRPDGVAAASGDGELRAMARRVAALEAALASPGGGAGSGAATPSQPPPIVAAPPPPPVAEMVVPGIAADVSIEAEESAAAGAPLIGIGTASPAVEPRPSASGGAGPLDLDGWLGAFARVVEAVNRRDPMLAGVLRSCLPVEGDATRLVIGAPFGFHLERLQDRLKAPLLREAAEAVAGHEVAVEAVFVGEALQRGAERSPRADGGAGAGVDASGIDAMGVDVTSALLEAFPGSRITGRQLREQPLGGAPWGTAPGT